MSNVENVSYISLKSLVLGYTLPAGNAGVGMRFFVPGQNLFTLTDYSGGDPLKMLSDTGMDRTVISSPTQTPKTKIPSHEKGESIAEITANGKIKGKARLAAKSLDGLH